MQQTNQDQLSWSQQRSPTGKFCIHRKHLSLALGGIKDVGTWGGWPPLRRGADPRATRGRQLAPALPRRPVGVVHRLERARRGAHAGRCEALRGRRLPVVPARRGPPAHHTGEADLFYYVVTDQPPADVIAYPNSKKWFVKPQRKFFRMHEVDYYEGEDGPPAG
jgi:hypothetical protein